MKKMSLQELFGNSNSLQYYLSFRAGSVLIEIESQLGTVTTEAEAKHVCEKVLAANNIHPQEDIVRMLSLSAQALVTSSEGREFCKNFEARQGETTFTATDALEVQRIVKKETEKFLKPLPER